MKAFFSHWQTQVLLVFSFFVLLGLPVWWKTTTVYRAELPFGETQTLLALKKPLLPVSLDFVLHGVSFDSANQQALEKTLNTKKFLADHEVKFYLKFHSPGKSLVGETPHERDDWLKSQAVSNTGGLTLFLVSNPKAAEVVVTLGKYRHGWIEVPETTTKSLQDQLIPVIVGICHNIYGVSDTTRTKAALDMIHAKFASSYRLSFSLGNGNPGLVQGWDFSQAFRAYMKPLIDKHLLIANLSVEDQVVHYTYLNHLKNPRVDPKTKLKYFTKEELPFFVDSNAWNLDFVVDTQIALNFLLYVPEARLHPLGIKKPDGNFSKTNGFLVPQWGGVVIHNPPDDLQDGLLRKESLKDAFSVFVSQFRDCFGLPSAKRRINSIRKSLKNQNIKFHILQSSKTGVSDWEFDSILFKRLKTAQKETLKNLIRFTNLVNKLNQIPIQDYIAGSLNQVLRNINNSLDLIKSHDFIEAFSAAKSAYDTTETVFFDGSMLAMLYFPEEHKWAVYLPLFLPLCFPLLRGLRNEWRRHRAVTNFVTILRPYNGPETSRYIRG